MPYIFLFFLFHLPVCRPQPKDKDYHILTTSNVSDKPNSSKECVGKNGLIFDRFAPNPIEARVRAERRLPYIPFFHLEKKPLFKQLI